MYYRCDCCHKEIKFPKGDKFVPIFIIEYYGITSWFCSTECRFKFMKRCSSDAKVDKAGHIIIE